LILVDLDNFKQYNDDHGHVAGDDLLRKVGRIIRRNIRQGVDSGYRYGGDEFAIVLIDATEDNAKTIGSRIQSAIEEKGQQASTGYAYYMEEMSPEAFVAKADSSLYNAKRCPCFGSRFKPSKSPLPPPKYGLTLLSARR
jgi:two-component system cell cycle response regulator